MQLLEKFKKNNSVHGVQSHLKFWYLTLFKAFSLNFAKSCVLKCLLNLILQKKLGTVLWLVCYSFQPPNPPSQNWTSNLPGFVLSASETPARHKERFGYTQGWKEYQPPSNQCCLKEVLPSRYSCNAVLSYLIFSVHVQQLHLQRDVRLASGSRITNEPFYLVLLFIS